MDFGRSCGSTGAILTVSTGVFRPDVADDPDLCRHDIQLLGNLFPDAAQLAAASTDFLGRIEVVHPLNPGQISRQGFSAAFLAAVRRDLNLLRDRLVLVRRGFRHIEQRQRHGAALDRRFFTLAAKELGTQVTDLLQQDIRFLVVMILKIKQHPLELVAVVR